MPSIKLGGVREDAYTDDINLAYKLEDGMKIYIPTKQEKESANTIDTSRTTEAESESYITTSSGVVVNSEESESIQSSKVNINTATQTQLETLSGIGPSTAAKIIAYREENGKFTKIEDIKNVSGIGESKFEKIKDDIVVK